MKLRNLAKIFPFALPVAALFVWMSCGENFSFGTGSFTDNGDGTFTCSIGSTSATCIDSDGDGEPDRFPDGPIFDPTVPDGDGETPTQPVDNDPIPDDGPPGGVCGESCPNHFDVDSFRPECKSDLTKQCYHQHEYDKKEPHYAVVDFLADTKFQFSPAVEGCSDLKIHFRHANKVSGKIELVIGGNRHFISSNTSFASELGANEGDWVTSASGSISIFRLQPNNLNILVGTQPGVVQKDAAKRHCAFTIQAFCGSDKVWEFATYEHISGDRGADCSD